MTYLSQDTVDDARNAHGCGVPIDQIAGQLGISEDELRRLLGLPQWKPIQGTLFPQLGFER